MGLDGFYLSYASGRLPSLPSLLLSPSVRHVMKHYSPEFHSCVLFQCALLQGGTGVYVMQMCRGYPCAHDIASALWKTPQTPVIKSTSASNNNVLHLTLCSENMWEKNPPNTSQFKKKNTYRTSSRQWRWWTRVSVSPSVRCLYPRGIHEKKIKSPF